MVKEDITKGVYKDFGMSVNGAMGIIIIDDLSEKELYALIIRFQPYISFEIHPLLSVDDLINILQKAMKSLKK